MPGERYDYWTVRAARESIAAVRTFIRDDLPAVAERSGATFLGAWAGVGSIGWHDDEFVALLSAPSESIYPFAGLSGIADSTHESLAATARPTSVAPLARDTSVFAHRWFEVAPEDWDEFLELSTGAWPAFEAAYGARIEGLFRVADARALLLTRYPSLASWQESRGATRPGSVSEEVADANRRFLRRRELTRRSIVRVGWLV